MIERCECGICVQYGCECTVTGDHTGCLCHCGDTLATVSEEEEITETEVKETHPDPNLDEMKTEEEIPNSDEYESDETNSGEPLI